MLLKRLSGFQIGIGIFALLYAAGFIFMLVFHPGSEEFYQNFNNIYQIIPPLFAGICGLAYVNKGRHYSVPVRIGWLWVAIAGFAFMTGQSAWTYYESIRGIEAPVPGLPDVGYLGAGVCLLISVVFLFSSSHITGRIRLLLDSALAASSVGVLSWYFLVQRLWDNPEVPLLGKIVSVAYPLNDVAVLFGAFILLNSTARIKHLRYPLALLAAGALLISFADTLYTFYTLNDAYHTGSWFDWGWSFGWLMIGFASLCALWWPQADQSLVEETAARHAIQLPNILDSVTLLGVARVLAPYIFAAVSIGFIAYHDYSHPKNGAYYISNSVFMLALWLIFLVVLRQVFTLIENQFLAVQLRSFNANLEQIVAHRTGQLTALHQLTKAVNDTLAMEQVLAAATEHTLAALQADAVLLQINSAALSANEQNADERNARGIGPKQTAPVTVQRGLGDRPDIIEYINGQPMLSHVEEVSLPSSWRIEPAERAAKKEAEGGWMRAPLLWQGQVIGTLSVIRWHNGFGPTDADTLESIGVEVGTAYHNAHTYSVAVEAADHDSVTGLLNHRAVHQRMEAEFGRASRHNSPLSVIMMDLNNFKLFNDTYGHPVGDQVLKRVAHVLEVECRKFDILARYGGDEFLAILPDTDEPLAMIVAQRLRTRMSQEGFQLTGDERTIPVTLSFGVATYPTDGTNRHELLTIADANLYGAKLSDSGIKSSSATQRSSRELRTDSSFEVLDAMVTAVDNKDRYTRRHSEDVTEYALWIAEEMGLSEETMRIIRVGGLLHDVGKIGVPEDILHKPGRLTPEEYEVMKRHPQLGALIVGGVPGMEAITDIVRSHHERWDGQGYPDGLQGEDTPLLGRLLAVADAYSAMTTARPYRQGMEWQAAVEEIRNNIGTQFDPQMALAFLDAAQKRRTAEDDIEALDARLLQRRVSDEREPLRNGHQEPVVENQRS
jgi:diguanylate cyclase (GGDEF)-like protein/putative nucleotidyltransferase with HDIG domain